MLNQVCDGARIARHARGIDATPAPQTSHRNVRLRPDPAARATQQPMIIRKKGAASKDVFAAAPAASPVRKIRVAVGLAFTEASHASKLKNMHNAYGCASSPD